MPDEQPENLATTKQQDEDRAWEFLIEATEKASLELEERRKEIDRLLEEYGVK